MINKNNCVGCNVCSYICPKNCIKMEMNSNGFQYPKVNINQCINCGLCNKFCIKEIKLDFNNPILNYASWSKNEDDRKLSTSGGMFLSFAKYYLNNKKNSYICCVKEKNDNLEYIITDKIEDLYFSVGSKYYQGIIKKNILLKISKILKEEGYLLFFGIPCQIAACKNYLIQNKVSIDNILFVELLCHGTTSSKIVNQYRYEVSKKEKMKLIHHTFRTKNCFNHSHFSSYSFENGKKIIKSNEDDYLMRLYFSDKILRESCYKCLFAKKQRIGDITIGDFNGIREYIKENEIVDKGVSCVLVNTKKGEQFLKLLNNDINLYKVNFEDIAKQNYPLLRPSKKPFSRSMCLILINIIGVIKTSIITSVKYYIKKLVFLIGGNSFLDKIRILLKRNTIRY